MLKTSDNSLLANGPHKFRTRGCKRNGVSLVNEVGLCVAGCDANGVCEGIHSLLSTCFKGAIQSKQGGSENSEWVWNKNCALKKQITYIIIFTDNYFLTSLDLTL